MPQTVRFTGVREVVRVTDELSRETKKAVRDEIRQAVEPVRAQAQATMLSFLETHGGRSRQTRFGVSVRRTGVVSVEQRVRSKGTGSKRPRFSELQLEDALIPAANANAAGIERHMVDVLERLQRKWVTG